MTGGYVYHKRLMVLAQLGHIKGSQCHQNQQVWVKSEL